MPWYFQGYGAGVTLGTDKLGAFIIHGAGEQYCRPEGGDARIYELTQQIEGIWSVYPSNGDFRVFGAGLRQLAGRHNRPVAAISYYAAASGAKASIGAIVVVPIHMFQAFIELGKLLVANPALRYSLTLQFSGLAQPDDDASQLPTVERFATANPRHQKPYLSDEVTLSVSNPKTGS